MVDQEKEKVNVGGTAMCIIHIVPNAKDKVSGFTEVLEGTITMC